MSDKLPIQYFNYDSWWYIKGEDLGVKSWTPQSGIFPGGMDHLHEQTGLPVIGHNRYWAIDTVYSEDNGGQYQFVIEKENKRALPVDAEFWKYLFGSSTIWGLEVYEQDWQDRQYVDMDVTHTNFTAARDWLLQMGAGASLHNVTLQYCMSLPRQVLQSSQVASVRRLRTSGDYILSKDNWRIGTSGLLASALGLSSFKNVFWTSERNPGNKFYYNCMDVSNNTDPNVPWSLAYRYTGYQNVTKSGRQCLSWYELEWHWKFPQSDLERDGCRSMPGSQYAGGKPFCFYEGSPGVPESQWKWEECDIAVCEVNCTRPGLETTNPALPPCEEYIEPDPFLQERNDTNIELFLLIPNQFFSFMN